MSERVLSIRRLNRALLARQLLLARSRQPLTQALERVGGLQAQYAPSAYIGLWSRLQHFSRDSLTTALEERRAVQATLMRATIHIVSARDYPLLSEGIRESRRKAWMRQQRHQADDFDMTAVAALLLSELRGKPRRQAEIIKLLEAEGFPRVTWSGANLWLDLVRLPPSGTWEHRRADLFGLADDWVGSSKATESEGLELLIRRYLGGFGPARLHDVANWAGVSMTTLRPVVKRLRLRRFRDENDDELIDLVGAPLPDEDSPAPIRFLPTWDASLLAHARRTQILPERYRPLVFATKTPHSVCTFLVDGAVAGKWRFEGGRVRLEPFGPIPRAARQELEAEAEHLATFHGP